VTVVRHTMMTDFNQFNMTRFFYAILFFSLILLSCGKAKTDKDKEKINGVCDKFMLDFQHGNIPEVFQLLKINSIMAPAAIDTLQVTVVKQMSSVLSNYGKILSFEFINERKIKTSLRNGFTS
jgi:hypothetical protein